MKAFLFHKRPRISLRAIKLLLLVLVIIGAFAVSGIAGAQIAGRYDMACRGALTSAGGVRQYTNANLAVISSVGQAGVGTSVSALRGLRAGYIQPVAHAALISREAFQTSEPAMIQQTSVTTMFLPLANVVIPVVRACSWL